MKTSFARSSIGGVVVACAIFGVCVVACVSSSGEVITTGGAQEAGQSGTLGAVCFDDGGCDDNLTCLDGLCLDTTSEAGSAHDAALARDATSGGDARSADTGADAAADAQSSVACMDGSAPATGKYATAHRAVPRPTIDADLSDWSCFPFMTISTTTNPYFGTPAASAKVSLVWESDGLYFAALVTDPTVGGTNATNPRNNDAVELYISAVNAPSGTGAYTPNDVEIAVDHLGTAVFYAQGNGTGASPAPTGFQVKTKAVTGGYAVEMFVPPEGFGATTLAASSVHLFDFQIDDNTDGGDHGPLDYVWFYQVNASPCGGSNHPSQSTCEWGTLTLAP
jgi:hypothetical protein